jgi:EpsI family protein
MKLLTTSILLAGSMAVASALSIVAKPTHKAEEVGRAFSLDATVPKAFGEWRELETTTIQVVNPQTQQILDKLYSQVLTRTYVHSGGYRIMLSLAYGDDQRGGLTAHRPEVCYPAQGFALLGKTDAPIATPYGTIAARRLSTSLGSRKEPVTYWFNVADTPVSNQLEQRWVEIRMGLLGQVPDGLLFRVSSIDDDTERAYRMQDAFVVALLNGVNESARLRLAGLRAPKANSS